MLLVVDYQSSGQSAAAVWEHNMNCLGLDHPNMNLAWVISRKPKPNSDAIPTERHFVQKGQDSKPADYSLPGYLSQKF